MYTNPERVEKLAFLNLHQLFPSAVFLNSFASFISYHCPLCDWFTVFSLPCVLIDSSLFVISFVSNYFCTIKMSFDWSSFV